MEMQLRSIVEPENLNIGFLYLLKNERNHYKIQYSRNEYNIRVLDNVILYKKVECYQYKKRHLKKFLKDKEQDDLWINVENISLYFDLIDGYSNTKHDLTWVINYPIIINITNKIHLFRHIRHNNYFIIYLGNEYILPQDGELIFSSETISYAEHKYMSLCIILKDYISVPIYNPVCNTFNITYKHVRDNLLNLFKIL